MVRERAQTGSREGFILVEALATLVLSALILAGLASLLALMLRASDRVAARAERQEITGALLAALDRDISLAARAFWAGDGAPRYVFDGRPDRVLFALDPSPADRAAGPAGGATLVVLQASEVAGGGRLLRAAGRLPPAARSVEDVQIGPAEEVYRGASVVRFAYAGRLSPGTDRVIVDAWPSGSAMPSEVLVGFGPAGSSVAPYPVRLRLDADVGCAGNGPAFCSLRPPEPDGDDAGLAVPGQAASDGAGDDESGGNAGDFGQQGNADER